MQAGSNHLLFPTALLHDARKRAFFSTLASSSVLSSAFDGGLVRIEKSTSARINGLYPGEISSVHSTRARQMLQEAGHSGRQFNPAMGRVLGAWVLPLIDGSKPWTRYTVPALEFRRMLSEARHANQSFQLVYSRGFQPGKHLHSVTDEFWRTSQLTAGERPWEDGGRDGHNFDVFKISVDEEGHESCVSFGRQGVEGEESCSAAEVEHLRDLTLIERMFGGMIY
jgi:hypothetical protein